MKIPSRFPVFSNFLLSGVLKFCSPLISPAIFPTCVFMPVSVTIAFAWPLVTIVPEKTMLFMSPRERFSPLTAFSLFGMLKDSPVKADSSTKKPEASQTLASAHM